MNAVKNYFVTLAFKTLSRVSISDLHPAAARIVLEVLKKKTF